MNDNSGWARQSGLSDQIIVSFKDLYIFKGHWGPYCK